MSKVQFGFTSNKTLKIKQQSNEGEKEANAGSSSQLKITDLIKES